MAEEDSKHDLGWIRTLIFFIGAGFCYFLVGYGIYALIRDIMLIFMRR